MHSEECAAFIYKEEVTWCLPTRTRGLPSLKIKMRSSFYPSVNLSIDRPGSIVRQAFNVHQSQYKQPCQHTGCDKQELKLDWVSNQSLAYKVPTWRGGMNIAFKISSVIQLKTSDCRLKFGIHTQKNICFVKCGISHSILAQQFLGWTSGHRGGSK